MKIYIHMCYYCTKILLKKIDNIPEYNNISEEKINSIVDRIKKNSNHKSINCLEKENTQSKVPIDERTKHYGLPYCYYCDGISNHTSINCKLNYHSKFSIDLTKLKDLFKWTKTFHGVTVFNDTKLILERELIEIKDIYPIFDAALNSGIIKNSTKKEYLKHFEKFFAEKNVTIELASFAPNLFNKFVEDNFSAKHTLSKNVNLYNPIGTFIAHTEKSDKVLDCHGCHGAFGPEHWGGGFVNNGLVQEELMVLQSIREIILLILKLFKLLPAESLVYVDLSERAVLLTTENKFMSTNSCYGREGLEKLKGNISSYFEARPEEIPFYAMKKAIISVNKDKNISKEHKFDIYRKALIVNIEAYALAMIQGKIQDMDQINIRDSDMGCGAYKHNVNAILMIQYMAFLFAQSYFAGSRVINYHYHRIGMVDRADCGLLEIFNIKNDTISVEEIWNKLWKFHDNYAEDLFSKYIPNSF